MQTIYLKAKSSSGDYYQVMFEVAETIKVSCNCNAGTFSKLCKHKTGLLSGDLNSLFDITEGSKLDGLIEIVNRSEYISLSKEYLSAKKAIEIAKQNEKEIKHKIEIALKEGIPLIPED